MNLLCRRLSVGWLPSSGFKWRPRMWSPSVLGSRFLFLHPLTCSPKIHRVMLFPGPPSWVLGWWAPLKLDQCGVGSQDPSHQPDPEERSAVFFLVRKLGWQKPGAARRSEWIKPPHRIVEIRDTSLLFNQRSISFLRSLSPSHSVILRWGLWRGCQSSSRASFLLHQSLLPVTPSWEPPKPW